MHDESPSPKGRWGSRIAHPLRWAKNFLRRLSFPVDSLGKTKRKLLLRSSMVRDLDYRVRQQKRQIRKLERARDRQQKKIQGLRRKVTGARREVARSRRSKLSLQSFISDLATTPWQTRRIANAIAELNASHAAVSNSLAHGMLEHAATRPTGLLALIKIQHRRQFHRHVLELLERYPAELIGATCFTEAVETYCRSQPEHALRLIESFLSEPEVAPIENADAHDEKLRCSLVTACYLERENLVERLLSVRATSEVGSDVIGALHQARERATQWLECRQSSETGSALRPGAVAFGLMSYRSVHKASTNIGDYFQTVAMIGLLSRFLPEDCIVHGGGFEAVNEIRKCVDRGSRPAAGRVDCFWIDRDLPATTPAAAPIWSPVNGWFMHPNLVGSYDFPFARNVRPIFLGMHVHQTAMLTADAVRYLKRYGPIGARDYHTVFLLLANGIDAFFAGCPTLTLDEVFGRPGPEQRSGRIRATAKAPKAPAPDDATDREHYDDTMPITPVGECLERAIDLLREYSRAEAVRTPLLHCYLPCVATGTTVQFTNRKKETDPRFEGLIGITEEERQTLKSRMLEKLEAVTAMILAGEDEEAVYAEWRRINQDDVTAARDLLESRRVEILTPAAGSSRLPAPSTASYLAGERSGQPQRREDAAEVVFCFDVNLQRPAGPTLRSLMRNASGPVRLTLLTRDIEEDWVRGLSTAYPDSELVWIDASEVSYGELNLLPHTTPSTMDRLFIPQLVDLADRVVYLDVDIVVLGDVAELFAIDLEGNAIAGREGMSPSWGCGCGMTKVIEPMLSPEQLHTFRTEFAYSQSLQFGCFNAGVLVMDLCRLRSDGFTTKLLQTVTRYGVNDQFALNLYASGAFRRLPSSWNHIATQEFLDQPNLIHFTGPIKPWDAEYTARAEVWREYVEPEDGIEFEKMTDKTWYA